jgi:hypothetical protein
MKIIKVKRSIQITDNDLKFVDKISKKHDWSISKTIYKIFNLGIKYLQTVKNPAASIQSENFSERYL